MQSRRKALQALAAGALSTAAGRVWSEDDKSPITILVGAASSMDFTARVVADQLHEVLGRPVLVQARLGAGQRLALGEARRAAPDGRTLVFATNGPFAIYPHIYTKLDYDPDRDFTPIAGVSSFDVALATGPQTGAADLKQLITWARGAKGEAMFGSAPGNGSLSHFVGISINLATGLQMQHVPYKDSSVGIVDLASARLPIMITGLSALVELHKAGKIRILAISGDKRSPLVPDVPTLKEAGVNVSSTTSTGLFGPARLPQELTTRLHSALQPMFANPATREKLAQQGMTPWPVAGAALAASLVEDRKRFEGLVKASGYVPEAA
jgi:tripartite-type tricarboxylate transporter receptor subunit TctC